VGHGLELGARFVMANDHETRELGLRGLYLEARRLGAKEAARQYAEKAADNAPYLPWAAQATIEYRSQAGRWDDAIR
ncbi:heme biosynthesis protein HemY, partial [Rhizobium johnstonii]